MSIHMPLTVPEQAYITALVETGLFGSTEDEVLRTLMLQGIQLAAEKGFIAVGEHMIARNR